MIRHIWKLVWNRKRANALIVLEILAAFLVLYAVALVGVYFANNYRQPLGYSYDHVWCVEIDVKQTSDDFHSNEQVELTRQVLLAAKEFPEVEQSAGILTVPYSTNTSISGIELNGRVIRFQQNETTDDLDKTMGLQLTAGRWFSPEDSAANYRPVVINQKLAREIFGRENPLGRVVPDMGRTIEYRVVGVITDFREDGELVGLENYLFQRADLNNPKLRPPRNLMVKVRPGTTVAFEDKLVKKLRSVAKTWSFEVKPVDRMRDAALMNQLTTLTVFSVIVGFLLIMVSLGLLGVLWQNVTQRTKEIGLRRALGATAGEVYAQIVGELLMIATLGLTIGSVIVLQFPLLKVVDFVSPKIYFITLVLSLGIIYSLTVLCGLYPGWLATRIQPSEALHYE